MKFTVAHLPVLQGKSLQPFAEAQLEDVYNLAKE